MAGPIGEPRDKADRPKSPVPPGCGKMRRLLRRALRHRTQATTFVARLAFIRILPATQSAWDLFRGSLGSLAQQRRHPGTLFLQLLEGGVHPLARERVDL